MKTISKKILDLVKSKKTLRMVGLVALLLVVVGLALAALKEPSLFRAYLSSGSRNYGGSYGTSYIPNPDGGGGGLPPLPLPKPVVIPRLEPVIYTRPFEQMPTLERVELRIVSNPCGNSSLDTGEVCDDGNRLDGDYCSADCKTATGSCGDGTKQSNEVCDQGASNSNAWAFAQHCGTNCQWAPSCGDAQIGGTEYCDGSNLNSKTCATALAQGFTGSLSCNLNCTFNTSACYAPYCGDGVKFGNEGCDDQNITVSDGCSASCQVETGWACTQNSAGKSTCARAAQCGDGVVTSPETCEPSVTNLSCAYGQQSCSVCNNCVSQPGTVVGYCGDATIQSANNETCDGTNFGSKTCASEVGAGSTGSLSCSSSCTVSTASCSAVPRCGDGILGNTAGEQCDPPSASLNCAYGDASCQRCSSTCQNVSGTVVGRCGDGTIQADNGEACDGANLGNQTCSGATSGARPNGALACNSSCQLNTDACAAYSITNCPVTVLAGYTTHPSAHKNAKIYASGGSSYSWKLDGVSVAGVSNYVKLTNMAVGSHTLTLNDSVTCGPFTVVAYTSGDVTTANGLAARTSKTYTDLELLLYDWNGEVDEELGRDTITANACPPAPSGAVKSDKIGIYGATTATTADDGTNCP